MGKGEGRGRGKGGLDTEDFQSLISVAVLEPNEAGLRYNEVDFSIDTSQVYTGGRYFLGVGQRFIKYTRTVQSVKFQDSNAISARTQDGLPLSLEVSFNYRVRVDSATALEELFILYGEMPEVKTVYSRIARNIVREVASQFSTFQYFSNRTRIEGDMKFSLGVSLDEVNAVVESFELLNFRLPSAFDDARDRFLAAQQDVEKSRNERVVAVASAGSRVDRAIEEAARFQTRADGYSKSRLINAEAEVADISARLEAFSEGMAAIADSLNATTPEVLSIIWAEALQAARDAGNPITLTAKPPDGFSLFPVAPDNDVPN